MTTEEKHIWRECKHLHTRRLKKKIINTKTGCIEKRREKELTYKGRPTIFIIEILRNGHKIFEYKTKRFVIENALQFLKSTSTFEGTFIISSSSD